MKLLLDDKIIAGHDLNANEACIFAAILKCTRSGRENETLWATITEQTSVQNGRQTVQNGQTSVQNGRQTVQNGLPPNNPSIINNMNENQLSSPAQDTRTEEKKTEEGLDFMDFWFLFSAPKDKLNRENACRRLWESTTFTRAKKQAIIKELTNHQMDGTFTEERNPYFFLNNFPEPQPVFLRGDESGDIVQVRYNGAYKLCTRETMELFNLQWERDW